MILVVNAGSSSLKVELFGPDLTSVLSASVSEIGGEARIKLGIDARPIHAQDHAEALAAILDGLQSQGHALSELTAAGHRVVHGGTELTRPTELTPEVLDQITACVPLAPLHNPHNLSAIDSLAARLPNLRQFACFDTSFHSSNPEVASTYALPKEEREKGLRRYGFHGLSYSALVESFGDDLPSRLLAFHLGNGAMVHAVHADADISEKGRAQSGGTMVNYLYDLGAVAQNHEHYATTSEVLATPEVKQLAGAGAPSRV